MSRHPLSTRFGTDSKINELTYSDTGKEISEDDKEQLLEVIKKDLKPQAKPGYFVKEADLQAYNNLVAYMQQLLLG